MFTVVLTVWLLWATYCVHVTRARLLQHADSILRALADKNVEAARDNAERMIELMTF